MAQQIAVTPAHAGVRGVEIGPDGPRGSEGVHIGTMFRFKGLEYQRMIIAGVSEGLVPRQAVLRLQRTDALRYKRELLRALVAVRRRDAVP